MVRTYDMTNRAQQAAQTTHRIAEATETLLTERPIVDVTLQSIAEESGVTVQTVLRHMGSREGCFGVVRQQLGTRVQEQREGSAPGDVEGAIAGLLAHYEAEGRLVLNLLTQEHGGDPLVVEAAQTGRAYHRAWVQRCFGPRLREPSETTVDALVAATDLYIWKLLRLDLGRSPDATRTVISALINAVLEDS